MNLLLRTVKSAMDSLLSKILVSWSGRFFPCLERALLQKRLLGITSLSSLRKPSCLLLNTPPSFSKRKNMSLSGKLKLLTDENIPKLVFEFLANKGFDVKRAALGSKDEFISEIAKSEGRVILSFDRHFGNTRENRRFSVS